MSAFCFAPSRVGFLISAIALMATLGAPTLRSEETENPTRLPAPPEDAQKKELKLLKEIYAPYPPKTPTARLELGRKLIAEARTSREDTAAQFVLFREAGDLCAAGGDFDSAMRALDEMATSFAVDARAIKLASLKAARGSRLPPASAASAGAAAVSIGWEAMRGGDFSQASQAAALAEGFASQAGDKKLATESQTLSTDAGRAAQESKHASIAADKLKVDPNDPPANRAVGRFLCLWQGRWESGLPLLIKSDDSVLKPAAEADGANPTTAAAQLSLAEQWFALSAKESGMIRSRLRERAAFWYDRATPGLNGLQQTLARRRLAEIDSGEAANPLSSSPAAILTRQFNDPAQWINQIGKWQIGAGKVRGEGSTEISFAQPLPGDVVLSFRINMVSGMRPRIFFDGTGLMYGNEGYAMGLNPFGVSVTSGGNFPYANNQPHLLRFSFSSGHYEIDVDGKAAAKGNCTPTPAIKLRMRGGDSWSPGTTEFWDFNVESASRPASP